MNFFTKSLIPVGLLGAFFYGQKLYYGYDQHHRITHHIAYNFIMLLKLLIILEGSSNLVLF